MTFEMCAILASKRAYRKRLAALPIGEKLRMLEALRERTLEIAVARRRMRLKRRPAGDGVTGTERTSS